ncbi:class C beta-lactamase [Phreatobacter stygius]|uniref:Beta-lactamase n=1 Tax=Phreatobacter stygius TaxID=1940610 RepID=A0A4D7BFK8_9HYPH|nr:class C beta-lactamase [Phreatobacter stygius]QCI69213.1 beta-lactamase [Phreatobacter stygius]
MALASAPHASAGALRDADVKQAVDDAMTPIIEQFGIPGLAVAVTINGQRHFFDYGLASREPRVPVTRDTLFELGSISKTFTATLATSAEVAGKLSLDGNIGDHLPELAGTPLGRVSVRDLATHTAGGFPLQVPDTVRDRDQLMAYFRNWKPQFAAGTRRSYANPSVGLLGVIAARSMGDSFENLMERRLFPDLGLRRTYINVPPNEMKSYAWGYTRADAPVRVGPGMLASEAYGVKSNSVDMMRFLEVNMGLGEVPERVSRAVMATHTGSFRAGPFVQDLIWEHYPYPVALANLVAGNAPSANREPMPVERIEPPMAPRQDVLINKTGSTNGFGAYVAYIPARRIGIVMLANKNYPNEARVRAAFAVLSRLAP